MQKTQKSRKLVTYFGVGEKNESLGTRLSKQKQFCAVSWDECDLIPFDVRTEKFFTKEQKKRR